MVTDSGVYVLTISQTVFGFEPVSRRKWSDRFTSMQPTVSGIVFFNTGLLFTPRSYHTDSVACLWHTMHEWRRVVCVQDIIASVGSSCCRSSLAPVFTLGSSCSCTLVRTEALRLFVQSGRNWFASVPCAITITYECCVLAQGCAFAHARLLIVRRDRAGWHSASLPARSVYGALSCRESRPVCPSSHGRYDYSPNTE